MVSLYFFFKFFHLFKTCCFDILIPASDMTFWIWPQRHSWCFVLLNSSSRLVLKTMRYFSYLSVQIWTCKTREKIFRINILNQQDFHSYQQALIFVLKDIYKINLLNPLSNALSIWLHIYIVNYHLIKTIIWNWQTESQQITKYSKACCSFFNPQKCSNKIRW